MGQYNAPVASAAESVTAEREDCTSITQPCPVGLIEIGHNRVQIAKPGSDFYHVLEPIVDPKVECSEFNDLRKLVKPC